jgi:hypothetical protein
MPGDASADRRETRLTPERETKPDQAPRPAEVNTHIGALLRTMHDSVLDEPVPDRLLDLLRQMEERKETGGTLAKPA